MIRDGLYSLYTGLIHTLKKGVLIHSLGMIRSQKCTEAGLYGLTTDLTTYYMDAI